MTLTPEEPSIKNEVTKPEKLKSRFRLKEDNNKLREMKKFYLKNFIAIIVTTLIAVGLLLRYFIVKSTLGQIDEREALAFLNSKDFSEGHFSSMRSGSSFGGSLETFFMAPVVKFWGMSQTTTWVIPTLLLVISSMILWRGFEHTPYKNTMRLVMGSLWIFPSYLVTSSTQATGHLATQLLLQVIIFATAYYAAHSLRNKRYFYGWAFASGIAFWVNPISLAVSVICLIWIFDSAPILKKQKLKATAFFVLGSSILWIYVLNNLLSDGRFFKSQAGIDSVGDNTSKSLAAFSKAFGNSTYSGKNIFRSGTSIALWVVLGIAFLTIWVFVALGLKRIDTKKTTDFAFLQLSVFTLWIAVVIIYAIANRSVDSDHLTAIIIPTIFLIMNAKKTHLLRLVAIVGMLIFSISGIAITIDNSSNSTHSSVLQANAALKENKISNAIATHKLAYPIDVMSNDTILVTPFDGNNFDRRRSNIVHKNVQAIVVQFESKAQNDTALCIQSYFGTSFKRISTKDLDIYIVEKDARSKVWVAVKACNNRL